MKKAILLILMSFSVFSWADQVTVTVPVPEGAKKVIVKATNVEVDACNHHQLVVTEAFGANAAFYVGVSGTEIACPPHAMKHIDLEGSAEIIEAPNGKVKFVFETFGLKNLEFGFE